MPAKQLFKALELKYPTAEITSTPVEKFSSSDRSLGTTNKITVKPAYARSATHCYYAD